MILHDQDTHWQVPGADIPVCLALLGTRALPELSSLPGYASTSSETKWFRSKAEASFAN
jgi:hypothetical protein